MARRILHVSSEVAPYSKTGGLGDVAGALPRAQRARGDQAVVLTPFYGTISALGLERLGEVPPLRMGGQLFTPKLWRSVDGGTWFLDVPELYQRPPPDERIYGHADDPLRFAVLCRVAAQLAARFALVHLHDWQAALTAVYLEGKRPVIQTVHNLAYMGSVEFGWADALEIPTGLRSFEGLEFHGRLSLLKAGLVLADRITTVSPTYALEIQSEPGGQGLAGLLRHRAYALSGILNGLDGVGWNPSTDAALPATFHAKDLKGRDLCGLDLRRELGLEERPTFVVISRAAWQKGLDLLAEVVPALVAAGGNVAVLASGDRGIEAALRAAEVPGRVAIRLQFDEALARRMYAGGDFVLIPSRFEPCGLTQLIGMRYGAIPVVRATGGLADTVVDGHTGISFPEATAGSLADAIHRALALTPEERAAMRHAGMTSDWSWGRSAEAYARLYDTLIEKGSP